MSVEYLKQTDEAPETTFKLILPSPKLYKLRCVEATFGKSKVRTDENTGDQTGGNPMITLDWEVVEPESVTIPDPDKPDEPNAKKVCNIAGLRVRDWVTLTTKAIKFQLPRLKRLGIDINTLDDENPNFLQFEGKTDHAILSSKADFDVDKETGQFIIVPSTGERKVSYKHRIVEWV